MQSNFKYLVFSGIFLAGVASTSLSHVSAQTVNVVSPQMGITIQQSQLWTQANTHISMSAPSKSYHPILHALANLIHGVEHAVSSTVQTITHIATNITHAISTGIHSVIHTISSGISLVSHIVSGLVNLAPPGFAGAQFVGDGVQLVFGNLFPPAELDPSAEVLAHSAGKTPVVLVQGSFGNSTSLQRYYNALEAAGIPTYAPTLGKGDSLIGTIIPLINGTAPVNTSAEELSQFINKVQAETGAPKVDLVAYSQGGLITQDYIAHSNKDNVQAVVSLGGTDHGVGLNGLTNYYYTLPKGVQKFIGGIVSAIVGPGQTDQFPDSPTVKDVTSYPDTKAGIHYLEIASKDDTVATPYQTTFLKPVPGADVTNIEVHSIPGVGNQNFNHLEYPFAPAVVKTVVNYIEAKGEPTPAISTPIAPAKQTVTPPEVSILGQ